MPNCSIFCHTNTNKHKKKKLMQKWRPVLPSLEEMVKADRQRSTATTFRSMTADGMKGRSRKELYIHTCAHTHMCNAPAFTLLLPIPGCFHADAE